MINFKKNEASGKFELVVDDVTASEDEVTIENHDLVPPKLLLSADIHDLQLQRKVIAHRFCDLPGYLLVLILNVDKDFIKIANVQEKVRVLPADIHRAIELGTISEYTISFDFDFDLENWKHLWSVTEYVEECKRIFTQKGFLGLVWSQRGHTSPTGGFSFSVSNLNKDTTIESEISKHADSVCELLELTEVTLMSKVRSESVVMQFDFPEEVRVPCEQYLLYFVQFLKDLGVEAIADIQHEAGQVLFSVTPTDKDEALDKIHSALRTYLELASSPISNSSDPEDEMAIQRLLANIDHLKSQLRLSYMMVRTQEATIQAQQVTIANQQRALSGEVLLDSLKNVTPQPKVEDKEELFGGTVAIKKYDGKFVEVNLPDLYRKLKRLFERQD